MLPPSHVAYTVATLSEIQKHSDYFEDADYRLVALAAIGPDLLDKPLSWAYFHKKYKSGRFFAHTFLAHAILFFYTLSKAPHELVYALSFNGHALADRMWNYQKTWYWPLRGWEFSGRRKGKQKPLGILLSYWYAVTQARTIFDWDVWSLMALAWFVVRNRLWEPKRLWHLVRTGRLLKLKLKHDKEVNGSQEANSMISPAIV